MPVPQMGGIPPLSYETSSPRPQTVTSLHSHDVFWVFSLSLFFVVVFLKKKKKREKERKRERKSARERPRAGAPSLKEAAGGFVSDGGTRGAETYRDPGQGSRRTLGPFVPEICVCE